MKTTTPKVGQIWQRQEDGQRLRVYGITNDTVWVENEENVQNRHGLGFGYFKRPDDYTLVQDLPRSEEKRKLAIELFSKRIQNRSEEISRLEWIIAGGRCPEQNEGIRRKIERLEGQIGFYKEIREDLKTLYSESV